MIKKPSKVIQNRPMGSRLFYKLNQKRTPKVKRNRNAHGWVVGRTEKGKEVVQENELVRHLQAGRDGEVEGHHHHVTITVEDLGQDQGLFNWQILLKNHSLHYHVLCLSISCL